MSLNRSMSEKPPYFEYVRKLVKEQAHLEIGEQSAHVVDSGLAHILRVHGYNSVKEVMDSVKEDPASTLTMHVVESMTTKETSFFRDSHVWEGLRTQVVPELIEKRQATRRLSVLSAAAASGQEAFSLAVLLREHFPQLANWNVRIVASDISREMVARIREATYSALEIARGMPEHLRDTYFKKVEGGYRVIDSVKELVRAQRMNLASPNLFLPKFDLILMRNLLIYFDMTSKRKLLSRIRSSMHPWTSLVLGASETTVNIDHAFEPTQHGSFRCFSLCEENL